jgi:BirA family transcriptional regulator, biotin operon repressor / biotin---[acetyl-CoA-carboxylase] ligase
VARGLFARTVIVYQKGEEASKAWANFRVIPISPALRLVGWPDPMYIRAEQAVEQGANDMTNLSAEAVARVRTSERFGRPVIFFERVGSTNDVAGRQAAAGEPEGLLVLAEEQTLGRGRMGRSWLSLMGTGLLFSLLLRPPIPASQAGRLTMCLGLGAVEGIERVTGIHPALKWPNDLVLEDRKLGGMLAELRTAGDMVQYAVLGLGLNVNGVPPDLAALSISLSATLGRDVDRLELLVEILSRCEYWYDRTLTGTESGDSIHAAWSARLETLGRDVTVTTAERQFRGRAVGVSPEGALLVDEEHGALRVVWGGDVTLQASRLGS